MKIPDRAAGTGVEWRTSFSLGRGSGAMDHPGGEDVTILLAELTKGNKEAASRLNSMVYDELRRLAGGYMRRERSDHTLQATALVHEAYL
jgi:hypothetical protein